MKPEAPNPPSESPPPPADSPCGSEAGRKPPGVEISPPPPPPAPESTSDTPDFQSGNF